MHSNPIIKELEQDVCDLVRKYMDIINIGEINEAIVGQIVCIACAAAVRHEQFDTVYMYEYFSDIILDNITRSYNFCKREKNV